MEKELKKDIESFLSNEYKEFAMYVIESRAIASVIDGMKPVQRKIIHVANNIWKTGSEKPMKIFQLSGKVASDVFYHHGDSSLNSAIINMAQKFKNNTPLLIEDGQFGSLRAPDAGAPRYIGTKLSKDFNKIYMDFNLLKYKQEEGELIEPTYFLPIIPMILVNGSEGIAVGFASNILRRNSKEIIEATMGYLLKGKVCELIPSVNGFIGKWERDSENHKKWKASGIYTKKNATTLVITELPPSMTYEKYENILDVLVDKGIIIDYDNNCMDNVNYVIKFKRNDLAKYTDSDILKILKLEENLTENLNTLDELGRLKIFERSEDILKYFVDFRLTWYDKRKADQISKLKRQITILDNRARFIKDICDNKLEVRKRKKEDIEKDLTQGKWERVDNSFEYLLKMPIFNLSIEHYQKMLLDKTNTEKELFLIEKKEPKKMYIDDLKTLLKDF